MTPMATRRGSDGWQPGRVAFWPGISLIVAGLLVLGYVGWQFWGTTWVSKREQRKITTSLQKQWTEGGDRLQPKHVPKGDASALVRIPKFGKKYVVPVLEGTSDEVLSKGYGHFTA